MIQKKLSFVSKRSKIRFGLPIVVAAVAAVGITSTVAQATPISFPTSYKGLTQVETKQKKLSYLLEMVDHFSSIGDEVTAKAIEQAIDNYQFKYDSYKTPVIPPVVVVDSSGKQKLVRELDRNDDGTRQLVIAQLQQKERNNTISGKESWTLEQLLNIHKQRFPAAKVKVGHVLVKADETPARKDTNVQAKPQRKRKRSDELVKGKTPAAIAQHLEELKAQEAELNAEDDSPAAKKARIDVEEKQLDAWSPTESDYNGGLNSGETSSDGGFQFDFIQDSDRFDDDARMSDAQDEQPAAAAVVAPQSSLEWDNWDSFETAADRGYSEQFDDPFMTSYDVLGTDRSFEFDQLFS